MTRSSSRNVYVSEVVIPAVRKDNTRISVHRSATKADSKHIFPST